MTDSLPVAALSAPEGRRLRRLAGDLRAEARRRGRDPELGAATEFARREPGVPAELRAACLTQARLAERAGTDPEGWLWTDVGLQQSTPSAVAAHRAASLTRRWGAPGRIADLCCGLGVDAGALAAAGWEVVAVEADPQTAAAARANLPGLSVRTGRAQDIVADLLGAAPPPDVAFCDPARRSPAGPQRGGRVPAERDPKRWSPPWSWVRGLAGRVPTFAKVAPGLPTSLVPGDGEIEWIALGEEVLEATVWFAPLARVSRRATIVGPDGRPVAEIVRDVPAAHHRAPVAHEPDGHLLEPHPVVVRAGLIDDLAGRLNAARLSPSGRWLTAARVPHSPFVRAWTVAAEMPTAPRRLRRELAERAPASVTYKTADIDRPADILAREVGLRFTRGGPHLTVAMVRIGERTRAYLVSRA